MTDPAVDDGFDNTAAIESTAVRMLAGREHSRAELRRKLLNRYGDCGAVDTVLDALERQRLLSDERFAEAYVGQRVRKGYGPLRIRAELEQRGIAAVLVARYLDDAAHDWPESMAATAAHKFGDMPETDRRGLAKRGRFLEQRGYPAGMIRRYLDRIRGF